ncbi:hypothetical protein H9P43_003728 [Blastocladiella emersonii ATCC 22665]|nr:hypothetical protein H9P43_003728 [Blastocladiella emersonii ATCC 22665]
MPSPPRLPLPLARASTHSSSSPPPPRPCRHPLDRCWCPGPGRRSSSTASRSRSRSRIRVDAAAVATTAPPAGTHFIAVGGSTGSTGSSHRDHTRPTGPIQRPARRSSSDGDCSGSSKGAAVSPRRLRVLRLASLYGPALLVLLIAAAATILAHRSVRYVEWKKFVSAVGTRCSIQASKFESELNGRLLTPTRAMAAFVAGRAAPVGDDVLARLCRATNFSSLNRALVAERVPDADRAAWEQRTGITIKEIDLFGDPQSGVRVSQFRPRPPGSRPEYWPGIATAPKNTSILGLDVNDGVRAPAFLAAAYRTSADGALSNAFPLVAAATEPDDPAGSYSYGIVYYAPSFDVPTNASGTPGNTTYVVSLAFNLRRFMDTAICPPSVASYMRYTLYVNNTVAYVSPSFPTDGAPTGLAVRRRLTLGGQPIMLLCQPTAPSAALYLTMWQIYAPIIAAVAGALLTFTVYRLTRRFQWSRKVEDLLGSWRSYSQAVIQANPNGMILVDHAGMVTGVNEPLMMLAGHNCTSIQSVFQITDLLKLIPPPDGDRRHREREHERNQAAADDHDHRDGTCETDALLGSPPRPPRSRSQHHYRHANTDAHHRRRRRQSPSPEWTRNPRVHQQLLLAPGRREAQLLGPHGALTDVVVSVSEPTDDPEVSQVLVLTDLTEQRARDRQLNELLEETKSLNQRQRRLLLFLAHELRNPVYVIQGTMQAVESDVDRSAVLAAAEHMRALLEGVVEYMGAADGNDGDAAEVSESAEGGWYHVDVAAESLHDLPACPLAAPPPAAATSPACVCVSPLTRRALAKIAVVGRTIPGTAANGWSVLDSPPPARAEVRLWLPPTLAPHEVKALTTRFDWSVPGQGAEFRLLGLQVAALRRLVERAGGSVSVARCAPSEPGSGYVLAVCVPVRACPAPPGAPCPLQSIKPPAPTRDAWPATAPTSPVPSRPPSGGCSPPATTAAAVSSALPVPADPPETRPAAAVSADLLPPPPPPPDPAARAPSPVAQCASPPAAAAHDTTSPDAAAAAAAAPGAPPPPQERTAVLVVEDNELVQRITVATLRRAGHVVHTAANGQEALDALLTPGSPARAAVGVVLMDLMMPVLDGVEATRRLRATDDAHVASLPVIAITANVLREELVRCYRAGFTGFMAKPVPKPRLLGAVAAALAGTAAGGGYEWPDDLLDS